MRPSLLPALIALGACVSPAAEPPPENQGLFTLRVPAVTQGCGDVFLYGTTAGNKRALYVNAPHLLADATAAGGHLEVAYALPHADVEVVVQGGRHLSALWCDDVVIHWPDVHWSAEPSSGELMMELSADPAGYGGWASAWLTGLELVNPATGEVRILPDIELLDLYVGWYAG
jgi:hypothetical protein